MGIWDIDTSKYRNKSCGGNESCCEESGDCTCEFELRKENYAVYRDALVNPDYWHRFLLHFIVPC